MSTGKTSPVNEVRTKPVQRGLHVAPQKRASTPSSTKKAQVPQKRSQSLLEQFINFLGKLIGAVGPDNTPYQRFLGQTVKIGFDDPDVKRRTLLDNAKWIFRQSERVIDHGKKQIARGRNPWEGLPENIGVPMSSEQELQSGNTPEQRYYHNAFFYNVSSALVNGLTILGSEDLDGTNTDKTTITFATRTVQALNQIHWNNQAVQGATEDIGVEYMLNTARGFGTKLLARNEGLEGSFTYGMHNSPLEELAGFDLKDQIDLAEKIMIAAMNGSVFHAPGRSTRISNKMLRADIIFREFPELTAEFFTNPARNHEFSAAESKGMTNYTLDTCNVTGSKYKYLRGDVYYPNFLRIVQFKEECVDNRAQGVSEEKAWENFRDRVLNDESSGVLSGLELYRKAETTKKILDEIIAAKLDCGRLIKAKEEFLQKGNISNDSQERQKQWEAYLNEVDFKFESGMWTTTNGPLVEYKNQYGHLNNFDNINFDSFKPLYDETETLDVLLQREHEKAFNHIRLLGSIEGDLEGGNDLEQYDYYKLLLSKPQAFFEKVTDGRLTALCFHFFNSRGTPKEGSIQDAVNTLRKFANKRQIRERVRELNANTKMPHSDIMAFVNEGKKIYVQKGAKAYLEWRLLQHMMHIFKKKELEKSPIFKCTDTELYFSESFLNKWEKDKSKRLSNSGNEIEGYIFWLREQFEQSGKPADELVDYLETVFPDEFVRDPSSVDLTSSQFEKYFYPDELFSINNKIAYTGEYSFHAVFALVDKRSLLKPDADFYLELQPAKEKFSAVPPFSVCKNGNYYVVSSGDSPSDTGTHVAALERGGIARIIYGLITDDDIYNEAISQRILYVNNIERHGVRTPGGEHALHELEIACNKYGTYGLQKVEGQDGYRKVVVNNGNTTYLDNGKTFSKQEIISEIKTQYAGRIERSPSPAAKIRRFAELVQLLTGRKIDFNPQELELARKLYAKDPTGESYAPGSKEREIFDSYRWVIVEEEKASLVSQDVPKFRVYFEYHDNNTGEIYFRRKSDGNLVSQKGQVFDRSESTLEKIPIIRNNSGNFVYKDTGEPYVNPEFLNNVLCEEFYLPSPSPVQGLFAHKGFLKMLGLGQGINKGKERLKAFISKMPILYNGALEWAGGLMAIGGLLRLGSIIGSKEGMLYKSGYWLSNIMRAGSAFTGALRGLLNVQKYYDITAGEIINIFSALLLPNGPKHLGIGIGNLILFTGRGRQRTQLQQRVNNFTLEEMEEKKPLKDIVDPRPYVREVTRFSTEDLILSAKNAARKVKLSPVLGEIGGNILSAMLTPIKMVGDIMRDRRLITQWKTRVSEKSGLHYRAAPSAGHLLTLVGLVSGIGAAIAGTLGRIGEVGEHGFNKLGNFAISFSNAIPAIGIIANGLEVANNPQGLPTIFRGLDGKDMRFDPKRAGYGQVFAGIMYAILPWFGLHKDSVAALYDTFATAPYFGLPGSRMSVAEEEKHNTVKLGRSVLIEGQEFYNEKNSRITL